jgi:MEDS: MEthanogen/methylotroph, DcmR Sensory domain
MGDGLDVRGSNGVSNFPESTNSSSHTLIFYEDDLALIDSLSQSVCSIICSGNSAIVIATASHHDGLAVQLRERCPNAYTAVIEGRLFLLDAEEILSKLIVNGRLDPDRCLSVMGNYITTLFAAARTKKPQVFAFGELVALLWERGNHAAALQLELLCTKLIEIPSLQLVCGYPLRLFPSDISATPILGIDTRQTRILRTNSAVGL